MWVNIYIYIYIHKIEGRKDYWLCNDQPKRYWVFIPNVQTASLSKIA